MATTKKMRVIEAVYTETHLYQIPEEWDIDKVFIKYGILHYDGVRQEDIKNVRLEEGDKYPDEIIEHTDGLDYLFDEDEEEDEDKDKDKE